MFEIKIEKKSNHIWVDLTGKLINEDDGKNEPSCVHSKEEIN